MVSGTFATRTTRTVALAVLAGAMTVGLSAPLTPNNAADASGERYSVSNWTDPKNKQHRVRWNPCQPTVTYAVNARLASKTRAGRASAIADVLEAFRRVERRTGIDFSYAGRTKEIPRNTSKESWSSRQKAAEVVVAWVDQSRPKTRSNLMTNSGSGYGSGVGGWMMRAWTDSDGHWQAAIGRGFVVINSAHNKIYRAGYGSGLTRGALLLHEVGHAMGLGHVGTTRELMYPTMLNREYTKYRDGDRTGLRKVGRPLGCIPGASEAWPQI
ncbi:MAG TPA: matrixin family metalloprotease [Actinomycetes bacterium]|nr:matrixin family metalloprotease [Actinomycetes bacterium]